MIKWFKAGFSFVVFCMVVILLLPKIFPALDPLIRDFFNPFLPSRPFVSEMTLKQENEEFRRQISQKIFDEKEFLRIQDENNSLRSKLNLSKKLPYEVEIMEVVERHPINWNYSFSVQNTNSDYLSSLHGVLIDGYLIGTGKLDGKKIDF